jgi:carbamoyl-phosphate synthase large subunit
VIVLGSGPNRIGQGVEFDTVCVHAVQALRAAGLETVMVNCNPETVSTDYDVADRLYIEPLTLEDVLEVCRAEAAAGPLLGVVVTLGGQTPLQLAHGLAEAGVPILGTPPEAIDLAEDRGRFAGVLERCGLNAPPWGEAASVEQALAVAERVGYPVLVRPSYVLGGRAMEVCYDRAALESSAALAGAGATGRPLLVDRFLEDAVEVDVDALADGREVLVCGVMEHIEEAGIHSGDSACVLPPITLGADQVAEIAEATERLAGALGVVGLLNVQFAIRRDRLYVLEANPRASRSVPFVEKVTGIAVGQAAARVMAGATLAELRAEGLLPPRDGLLAPEPPCVGVKEAVMPFARFPGADSLLGPEMRSTGEVVGLDRSFGPAFAKSQEAAYGALPTGGVAFISVRNADKRAIVLPAKLLADLGFKLLATAGTASVLARNGVPASVVRKVQEGPDNVVERMRAGQVDVVVNTPQGSGPRADGYEIRTAAVAHGKPCITTLSGLTAMVQGIEARIGGGFTVRSLQAWHAEASGTSP